MFRVSSIRPGLRRAILLSAIAAGLSGCGVEKQSMPPLTGPSELGLSLTLTAQPDQVVRDGRSRSTITVTARDTQGRPPSEPVTLTLSISPANAGSLSARQVVIQSNGAATFDFIAPPLSVPVPNNVVVIGATPVGNNFDNANTRTVSIALTASNTTAPTLSFTVTPSSPRLDQSVTFDASATTDEGGPCGDRCTYSWDFGGEARATGRVVNYQFKSVRTYTVVLTVTDATGASATAQQSVTVTPSVDPTADFTFSPSNPAPSDTVQFNGGDSKAANGATIVDYLWDFGDGHTASGITATEKFPDERTYVVRLTVRDSFGATATKTKSVTVKKPA
jgi:PKD repeat protein